MPFFSLSSPPIFPLLSMWLLLVISFTVSIFPCCFFTLLLQFFALQLSIPPAANGKSEKVVAFLLFLSRNSLISPPDSQHDPINSGISRAEGLELRCKGLDFVIVSVILQLEAFLSTTPTFQSLPPWHVKDVTAGFSVAFSSNKVQILLNRG